MKTLFVHQMPDGFEVDTPTFGYWFKAGAAFTLGAGSMMFIAAALGWAVGLSALAALGALFGR